MTVTPAGVQGAAGDASIGWNDPVRQNSLPTCHETISMIRIFVRSRARAAGGIQST
jgi:hypothetical protein